MSKETNPYESPQIVDTSDPQASAEELATPLKLCIWWTILFPINMIVPLAFSGMEARKNQDAIRGMGYACLLLYGLGLVFCARSRFVSRALCFGGLICALSNFFPILQFVCGSIGLEIARYFGLLTHNPEMIEGQDLGYDQLTTSAGGFVATFITGGLVIFVALAIGAMFYRKSYHLLTKQH